MATMTTTSTRTARRGSKPWIKIAKIPLLSGKKKQAVVDMESPPAPAFELPNLPSELMITITSYLDLKDLQMLRSCNRALNELIAGHESDIARYWSNIKLSHVPLHFDPFSADTSNWQYFLRRSRRWQISSSIGNEVVKYVQYKTPLHYRAQRALRFAPMAEHFHERLVPLLYSMSSYLSRMKAHIMRLAGDHDLSLECQAHLNSQTALLLQDISVQEVQCLHFTWLFLLWILNYILGKPTYAGSMERAIRGWTADPLDRSSLARLLIFGNLTAVHKLLKLGDYVERRKWAENFLRSLGPIGSLAWAEKWSRLDVGLDEVPDERQAKNALRMDIHMHCLWVQGASMVLSKKGPEFVIGEEQKKASTDNTMKFFSELTGFDLVDAAATPRSFGIALQERQNQRSRDDA